MSKVPAILAAAKIAGTYKKYMYHHRRGNLVGQMLKAIGEISGAFSWPLEYSNEWRYEQMRISYKSNKALYNTVWGMRRSGLVTIARQKGRQFLKLTAKGELRLLVKKISVIKKAKWDGKWRLVIFDIPEASKKQRNKLRGLLYEHGFRKLQASVFICPYPFNSQGIDYLNASGLKEFIRIMRVDKMDDEEKLLKMFNLKR